ncbi:MAG: hypothetical protein GX604_07455 [Actinobacteria bacterium]|nr:hypothetical protein [Actinomycetota bacterium]
MQLIVQEGRAIVSLTASIRAHDEVLRTTSFNELTEDIKVYYRDLEIIRIELRDGAIEVMPSAIGGIYWLEKGRRYQLKIAAE